MTRPATLTAAIVLFGCVSPTRQQPPAVDPGPGGKGDQGRPELSDEVCDDGADNDANGQIDEGCPCSPGQSLDCWPGAAELRGQGRCTAGVMTCEGDAATEWGTWGTCEEWVGPGIEACNGIDDDCDGQVDDDPSCDTGGCHSDGDCAPGEACAEGVCVGAGALRFTLTWDVPCDLDLHVLAPGGSEIDYRATEAEGGMLDRDDRQGTGPENIYWEQMPPSGDYVACVVPFRVDGPVHWTLLVDRDGLQPQVFEGTVEAVGEPYAAHCAAGSGYDVASLRVN